MATVAETQLDLYRQALLYCEEEPINAITNPASTPGQAYLDVVWNNGAGVNACLEEGEWTFATRTVALSYNPAYTPPFGYRYAFNKPADYLRTAGISADPYFNQPLQLYSDENTYWFCDLTAIYVRYISNDSHFGMDLTKWPESFKQFVAAHFASKIIGKLTHAQDKVQAMEKRRAQLLASARGKDGLNEEVKYFPAGSWSRARRGRGSGYRLSGRWDDAG